MAQDASDASRLKLLGKGPATMLICSVPYTMLESAEPSYHGSVLMDAGVRFLQTFILYSDFSISERLYATVEHGQELKGEFVPQRRLQHRAKTSTWTIDNNFIVEDGFAMDYDHSGSEPVFPGKDRPALLYSSSTESRHPRIVDFAWLAREIENGNRTISDQNVSAEDFVDCLQSSTNSLVTETSRIRSL